MSLKTYGVRPGLHDPHGLVHIDKGCHVEAPDLGVGDLATVMRCACKLKPGDWVKAGCWDGAGIIISIDDEQVTVLWSVEPRDRFTSIAFPIVRCKFASLPLPQLVGIQPMTAPTGAVFYLDYKYGSESKLDERCNSSSLHVKFFWRAYRCLKRSASFSTPLHDAFKRFLRGIKDRASTIHPSLPVAIGKGSTTRSSLLPEGETHRRALVERWQKSLMKNPPPSP